MRPWEIVAASDERESALAIVGHVAEQLRDPLRALEVMRLAREQSDLPTRTQTPLHYWLRRHAEIALLFGQMHRCFPSSGWDRVAHDYIAVAARSLADPSSPPEPPSIFGGVAGICFVTRYLSEDGKRYQRLLATLDSVLVDQLHKTAGSSALLQEGVGPSDYDLISGVTGIGAYLLECPDMSVGKQALDTVLDRLVFLSEVRDGRLRYFVSPNRQPTSRHREEFPDGYTDCGVAHGVPGPLAFLSLTQTHYGDGIDLRRPIRRLADWIIKHQAVDAWGITWPYAILPNGAGGESGAPYRNAWCYGSPGVARALWLAGCALSDTDLQAFACETLCAVHARPVAARGIPSPILCHGVAGLLQIVLRFANDTGAEVFTVMAHDLIHQLLNKFEANSALGFRDLEPDGRKVDSPNFLDGSVGVALTLLAAATDVEPSWDRMLLLS